MKATIKATTDGLKLADCFKDVKLAQGEVYNCVIGEFFIFNGGSGPESIGEEVTINLKSNQPNIYKCMEHGFKVEIDFKYLGLGQYDLSDWKRARILIKHMAHDKIKSIRILDMEQMEGIELLD